MALSDKPRAKAIKSSKRRSTAPGNNKKHWSDSQKVEAVTTYLALGNLTLTGSVLKIPEMTLRVWKKTVWWHEIEDELRIQEDLQLSKRLQGIIEKTLEVTEDRLKHGDFIYDNRSGKLMRKPVNMRDAHRVTMDMIDKREVLVNKQPTSVPIELIENKLQKLAEKFEQIANNKTKAQIEVTDVVFGEDGGIPNSELGGGTDGVGFRAESLGTGMHYDTDGVLEGGISEGKEGTPSP